MKEDLLKQVLENVSETPSARCWESIEQQLSVVMPATPQNEVPSSDPASSTPVSNSASQIASVAQKVAGFWGKVAGITAASATVVTVTILAVINANQDARPDAADKPEPSQKIIADTIHDETTSDTIQVFETPKPATPEDVVQKAKDPVPVPEQKQVPVIPADNHIASYPAAPVQSSVFNSVKPEIPVQPAQTQPVQPVTKPATKPAVPASVPSQEKHDPVIESRHLNEEPVYSKAMTIEIPNVITPNGDGFNDLFEVKGIENCTKSHLVITNRSGRIVLESNHYHNDWNGDNVEAGTYFYRFVYTINGIEQVKTGTLNVIK